MSTPTILASIPARPSAVPRSSRRLVFLTAVVIGTMVAVVGFWRTYFGPLLTGGTLDEALIVNAHAATMVIWLALVIGQVWFAASGRIRLHVRLGPWVMAYSVLMVLVWLLTISHAFADR